MSCSRNPKQHDLPPAPQGCEPQGVQAHSRAGLPRWGAAPQGLTWVEQSPTESGRLRTHRDTRHVKGVSLSCCSSCPSARGSGPVSEQCRGAAPASAGGRPGEERGSWHRAGPGSSTGKRCGQRCRNSYARNVCAISPVSGRPSPRLGLAGEQIPLVRPGPA